MDLAKAALLSLRRKAKRAAIGAAAFMLGYALAPTAYALCQRLAAPVYPAACSAPADGPR